MTRSRVIAASRLTGVAALLALLVAGLVLSAPAGATPGAISASPTADGVLRDRSSARYGIVYDGSRTLR